MPIYRKGQNQMELFKRAQLQDKQRKQEQDRLNSLINNSNAAIERFAEHLGSTDIPEKERIDDLINNVKPLLRNANDIGDYQNRQGSHAVGSNTTSKPNLTIGDLKEDQNTLDDELQSFSGDLDILGDANPRGSAIDMGHPISGDDLARGKHERKLFNQLGY